MNHKELNLFKEKYLDKHKQFEINPKTPPVYVDKYQQLPTYANNLPYLMKDVLIVIKEHMHIPYELAVPTVLGVINSVISPRYNVDTKLFQLKPTSMYFLSIVESGGRKSTLFNKLTKPIKEYQTMQEAKHETELETFALESAIYDKEKKAWKSGDPLPIKPTPVRGKNLILQNFTIGGLIDALTNQPYTSVLTPEAGNFTGGHSFQGKSTDGVAIKTQTGTYLTQMWDGDPVERLNRREDKVKLYNRRMNMLLLGQERVIRPLLNDPTFKSQGLINRFLITQLTDIETPPLESLNQTHINEENRKIDAALQPFHERISRIIKDMPIQEIPDKLFQLELRTISYDDAAGNLFKDFHNQYHTLMQDKNSAEYGIQGFLQRALEHAFRLAANIALFDLSLIIKAEHAQAAIDLMHFFIKQRLELDVGFNHHNEDLVDQTDKLIAYLRTQVYKNPTLTFNLGHFKSKGGPKWWQKLTTKQKLDILDELEGKDLLFISNRINPETGRKIEEITFNLTTVGNSELRQKKT
jgi:hypothetical protein